MSIGLLFWVLMVLWAIFGIGWRSGWVSDQYGPFGSTILAFVLFFLLGWHSFGFVIHG